MKFPQLGSIWKKTVYNRVVVITGVGEFHIRYRVLKSEPCDFRVGTNHVLHVSTFNNGYKQTCLLKEGLGK